jgi:Tol biopolymer transport system component
MVVEGGSPKNLRVMANKERKRLDSWGEIANYLRRDLRTVKRWEKRKGLPVHRLPGGKRQPVFAYQDEIDAWSHSDQNNNVATGPQSYIDVDQAIDSPTRNRKKWQRAVLIPAMAAFSLLCIGGAAFSLLLPAPKLRVVRYSQLTNDGRNKSGNLLTDGATVYFDEPGRDDGSLHAVSVYGGGTEVVPLTVTGAHFFDLSPQGSEFLAGRSFSEQDDGELWVVPLGGSPQRIGKLRASSAQWSRDMRQIAFTQVENVFIANADGSEPKRVASVPGQVTQVRWSPDGKTLRFTQTNFHDGEFLQQIWEVAKSGSNLHPLLSGWDSPASESCGTWTPDGKFYIFQSNHDGRNDLWALAETRGLFGRVSGSPIRLSYGLQGFYIPVVAADGKEVFALGDQPRGELVRLDSRLHEFVPFLGGISATWVGFAKSGRKFAYIAFPDSTVWRANADGTKKTQITFAPLQVDGFSWSPDEDQLALRARTPGEPWRIYLIPSLGGTPQLLVPAETEQGVPTWSPDGKEIAFGDVPSVFGKPSGQEVIHIFELSTHKLTDLPGSRGLWTARWSPDGRFIAALTIIGQRLMLYDVRKKRWRQTAADKINNPSWSTDSKYVYFDTNGHDRRIFRVGIYDGHATQLADLNGYPRLAASWSGLAADNSPMILRDLGTTEIYSMSLESH